MQESIELLSNEIGNSDKCFTAEQAFPSNY